MIVPQPQGGCYDQIDIPVYTDAEPNREVRGKDPRLKGVGYFIEQRKRLVLGEQGPYAITEITERYAGGMPYHFYTGHFYTTLEEALAIARLAEWHRRRLDERAAECVVQGDVACDLQAREAYRLLLGTQIADPVSVLNHFGTLSERTMQGLRQVGVCFAEHVGSGRDWRDARALTLLPDPLRLIQRVYHNSPSITVDWVATIRRVAAMVATERANGTWWSHEHAISLLLARQQIPCHWYLLRAALRRFVLESKGLVVFGRDTQKGSLPDYSTVCWGKARPLAQAGWIPSCAYCGHGRHLDCACPGYAYGHVANDTYVSSACPFDGYGCVPSPPQVETWGFDCCHCRAIRSMAESGAPIGKIEEEIGRRKREFLAAGGSPFRVASRILDGEGLGSGTAVGGTR